MLSNQSATTDTPKPIHPNLKRLISYIKILTLYHFIVPSRKSKIWHARLRLECSSLNALYSLGPYCTSIVLKQLKIS